jgi:peptidoglycan/LPS O-acetylase OafA/YrhL
MPAHSEIRSLTGLRGIAAAYVVLHHYTDALPGATQSSALLSHGYLAVDVFFVLSGFVMALNYRHLFATPPLWRAYTLFLGRRIARIYPLYLLGTLIAYAVVRSSVHDPAGLAALHRTLALNLAMVQSWVGAGSLDHSAWTLSAEWAAYLLFPVLLGLAFFKLTLRHWLCLAVCLAAVATLAHMRHHPAPFSFHDLTNLNRIHFLRCLPEFILGLLAARSLGTRFDRLLLFRPATATALSLILLALLFFPSTDLAFVLLLPLFLLSLMDTRSLTARLLSCGPAYFLGLISYSLYIVHTLFIGTLMRLHTWEPLHYLPPTTAYAATIGLAVAFGGLVVLPIATLTYHCVELPSTRLLRRWFDGPPLAFPPNSR